MQIRVADYPQLAGLCWNRLPEAVIDGQEALDLYERNWRWVDTDALSEEERALIASLVATYGRGVLHV
jgi:hypothetical protein